MSELRAGSVQPAAETMPYREAADLAPVRAFVRFRAAALGLSPGQVDRLILAVSELTTNTVQHTSGGGRVRIWADRGQVVCDVTDGGPPRTFGEMPAAESLRGRGLAIVRRVVDEVTTTTEPDGTTVRLRMNR